MFYVLWWFATDARQTHLGQISYPSPSPRDLPHFECNFRLSGTRVIFFPYLPVCPPWPPHVSSSPYWHFHLGSEGGGIAISSHFSPSLLLCLNSFGRSECCTVGAQLWSPGRREGGREGRRGSLCPFLPDGSIAYGSRPLRARSSPLCLRPSRSWAALIRNLRSRSSRRTVWTRTGN